VSSKSKALFDVTHHYTYTHAVQQALMLKHIVFWLTSPNTQCIVDKADWLCTNLTYTTIFSSSQNHYNFLQQQSSHHPLLYAVGQHLSLWWKSCLAHMQPKCISTANASSEIWEASASGAASAFDGATAAIAAVVPNA